MLLGLDLGTTAVKAVVLDPARGLLAADSLPNAPASPQPGWSEQDAGPGSATRSRSSRASALRPGIDPSAIACVGVAGCVPCVVLLDADDRPLRPALLYNDARAHAEIDELTAELADARVLQRTGAGITQQSVGPKLRWLQRHEPELWARTRRVAGSYDWLAGRLDGSRGSASATGRSRAASTTWARGAYAPDLCAAAGVGATCFGPIRDPADVVGGVSAAIAAAHGPARRHPRRRRAAPTTSSSALRRRPRAATATCSSSSAARSTSSRAATARCSTRASTSTPTRRPGLWLPNGCMASGGSGVRWFQRELAGGSGARTCSTRRRRRPPPGADGIVMLPYLLGEKTPVNDPLARGAFAGLHARARPRPPLPRRCSRASPTASGTTSRCWPSTACAPRGPASRTAAPRRGSGSRSSPTSPASSLEPVVDHPGSALGAAFAAGMGSGAFA